MPEEAKLQFHHRTSTIEQQDKEIVLYNDLIDLFFYVFFKAPNYKTFLYPETRLKMEEGSF